MLSSLTIKNLILIEDEKVEFGPHFNILTGETGAGKSALLTAIRLMAGARAESSYVGPFSNIAVVEGAFYSYHLPKEIEKPLENEPLIIRREIHKSGKSLIYANFQLISLSALKEIMQSSLEIVDQSSSIQLRSLEMQRDLIDLYSDAIDIRKDLEKSVSLEEKLKKEQTLLEMEKKQRDFELSWAEENLNLLDAVDFEKEEVFRKEHFALSCQEELVKKLAEVESSLTENVSPVDFLLGRCAKTLEGFGKINPELSSISSLLKTASLEVEEALSLLRVELNSSEQNPERLFELEEMIQKIEQIKKRFGQNSQEILQKKEELFLKIEHLHSLDKKSGALEKDLSSLHSQNERLSSALSELRLKGAKELSSLVEKELKELNLKGASFQIQFREKPLSLTGKEDPLFLFTANQGSVPSALEKCASGGELSRLLFALKISLSRKKNSSTLIFDEIDSNVGGRSSAILGDKLSELSQQSQVISVTHFLQVAKKATHHFLAKKIEEQGKTKTKLIGLSPQEKEDEYLRMIGSFVDEAKKFE